MTHEEFGADHRDRHAPLFCAFPAVRQHVRRDVQSHTVPGGIPRMPPVAFDGITELWCDDTAGLARLFTNEGYMRTIRPDEEAFLDLQACEFVLSTETALIP